MSTVRHRNFKNTLSKWLLAVVLIMCFFTFSGFTSQTQTKQDAQQTISVISCEIGHEKCISYKRALTQYYARHSSVSFFAKPTFCLDRLYSQQTKISITALTQSYIIRPKIGFYYHVNAIPQNADDHPATILV
jgi:hypothetical protein